MWRRWRHTSEFLFGIYWWTWKTTIEKNCCSGTIKNVKILIFTMLYFQKIYKIYIIYTIIIYIYLQYHQELSSVSFYCNHYFLFFSWTSWVKNLNFQKMKKTSCRYHHTMKVYYKSWLYDFWFLRYWLHWIDFFFQPGKSKFWKN